MNHSTIPSLSLLIQTNTSRLLLLLFLLQFLSFLRDLHFITHAAASPRAFRVVEHQLHHSVPSCLPFPALQRVLRADVLLQHRLCLLSLLDKQNFEVDFAVQRAEIPTNRLPARDRKLHLPLIAPFRSYVLCTAAVHSKNVGKCGSFLFDTSTMSYFVNRFSGYAASFTLAGTAVNLRKILCFEVSKKHGWARNALQLLLLKIRHPGLND